ncbi:MAG: prolipoprotein diacylglyceryl transferase [Coprococcus sp.]|nr:prolipoprotein diacylglyceryl transferase [Coprococcus sp.]
MAESISFPNLGIELEHVGRSFSLFGNDIAYYGIIIGMGILIGILITILEAKRSRQNPGDYMDLAIIVVIVSIIGARLFYVIFSWDMYKENPLSILNIRQGGMAVYGAVFGAIPAVFLFALFRQLSAAEMLDTACIGLAVGQAIGKWGNFFNREAFGEYTDGLFAMRLPVDAVRITDITDRMRNHIETVERVRFIQAHPTFLYESAWCLLLVAVLFFYRRHKRFQGELFLFYLFGYGLGRVWIEGLRTDSLLLPFFSIPVSQAISGILVIVCPILIIRGRIREERAKFRRGRNRNTLRQGKKKAPRDLRLK